MTKKLWEPSQARIDGTNMKRFCGLVNERHGLALADYPALWQWSVDHLTEFWAAAWDFLAIRSSERGRLVVDDLGKFPGAKWFPEARLNFAENLLQHRDAREALVFVGEGRPAVGMRYDELYDEVARVAAGLRRAGVGVGDRVAGFMPNMPQTVVAMLATTCLGAIWSSCSPDFGIKGVLDRFGQIQPKVLFCADGYTFKGKQFDSLERVADILADLPSIERVVVVPYISAAPDAARVPRGIGWSEFEPAAPGRTIEFGQLPFMHPLYIMFTSGTTGLPKCMVQSAGGILINQLKELVLHCDLGRDDTIFYFTTCGWMMWNWLVCSLAVGARVVLFDGNPFHPGPEALWKMAEEQRISIFGTSAGYLSALEASGYRPRQRHDLSALRAVLSTGSPLSVDSFEYVYRDIHPDIQLASIAGGSDINGCFVGGNPMGPVYAGEIQCRCLGMKVAAYDDTGKPIVGQEGELVCEAPAPSMPIYFFNDPDGKRYHEAYFDTYPGVWRHGDFIRITERGGVVIQGRSDATLNPGGVRIGTAEIYRQVEGLAEIADSLVIGQSWKNDVRVILFVQLADGQELTDELQARIRKAIRTNASPRHVPAKILAVPEIPYTLNMKKVELAVKKVVEGRPVLNKDALRNPQALDAFADLAELQQD
jgi:acetoacetyl-CoA synthetase